VNRGLPLLSLSLSLSLSLYFSRFVLPLDYRNSIRIYRHDRRRNVVAEVRGRPSEKAETRVARHANRRANDAACSRHVSLYRRKVTRNAASYRILLPALIDGVLAARRVMPAPAGSN